MGKTYKLALALLYLLQLVIVFHEQVLHLFERVSRESATEAVGPDAREQGILDNPQHAVADQGAAADTERLAATEPRRATVHGILAANKEEKHLPDHHEEKNKNDKRGRRKRVAEFLIENLFSRYKRMADPTAGASTEQRIPRFIACPETAMRQQAA